MPVFDEKGKPITVDDDFPNLPDPEEMRMKNRTKNPTNKRSLTIIILVAVSVILLFITGMLSIKVNSLNQEIVNLSLVKEQLAKARSEVTEITAEKERLKTKLTQSKEELAAMTTRKETIEADLQKSQEALSAAEKAAAAAKKKPVAGAKKNVKR